MKLCRYDIKSFYITVSLMEFFTIIHWYKGKAGNISDRFIFLIYPLCTNNIAQFHKKILKNKLRIVKINL